MAYFSPPLTTMRVDFREIGMTTFRMLHQQILTGQFGEHPVLDPELIIRPSTAAPRAHSL
ncbi:substrate-binding domain-containing protein [Mycetocola sp. 2940]|uniref:substrate-binding domain-containing protein n=1 Tax=Mycetocola sp. 2940 TaxID=3156452 RepID=UPI003396E829